MLSGQRRVQAEAPASTTYKGLRVEESGVFRNSEEGDRELDRTGCLLPSQRSRVFLKLGATGEF